MVRFMCDKVPLVDWWPLERNGVRTGKLQLSKVKSSQATVVCTMNPSTWETEAGRSL